MITAAYPFAAGAVSALLIQPVAMITPLTIISDYSEGLFPPSAGFMAACGVTVGCLLMNLVGSSPVALGFKVMNVALNVILSNMFFVSARHSSFIRKYPSSKKEFEKEFFKFPIHLMAITFLAAFVTYRIFNPYAALLHSTLTSYTGSWILIPNLDLLELPNDTKRSIANN